MVILFARVQIGGSKRFRTFLLFSFGVWGGDAMSIGTSSLSSMVVAPRACFSVQKQECLPSPITNPSGHDQDEMPELVRLPVLTRPSYLQSRRWANY